MFLPPNIRDSTTSIVSKNDHEAKKCSKAPNSKFKRTSILESFTDKAMAIYYISESKMYKLSNYTKSFPYLFHACGTRK